MLYLKHEKSNSKFLTMNLSLSLFWPCNNSSFNSLTTSHLSANSSGTPGYCLSKYYWYPICLYHNDTIVFKQARKNRLIRLVKFSLARLSTFLLDLLFTFLFVTQFPHIIGQFVNESLDKINAIETVLAQISIIILNYILSKLYVFKK